MLLLKKRDTVENLQDVPDSHRSLNLVGYFPKLRHRSCDVSLAFSSAARAKAACSVLSFQFLAPERNCVLVSAHVPINPCK